MYSTRDPKISEQRVVIFEEDVLRLDVTVDDTGFVRSGQGVGDLTENAHRDVHWKLALPIDALAK